MEKNKASQNKNWFKDCLQNKPLVQKIEKIKLVITDVDGCLTNGNILFIEPEGIIAKTFSVVDGFAIDRTITNTSLLIAFLSGRKDVSTQIRAKRLGIPEDLCFTGDDAAKDKTIKIKLIQKNKFILPEETLLLGDDFLDFQTKSVVGILACPQNAPFYFQDFADLIIPLNGGHSAFRLLLDLVLYIQKKHFAQEYIDKSLKK